MSAMRMCAIAPILTLVAGVGVFAQRETNGLTFHGQRVVLTPGEDAPNGISASACLMPSRVCFSAPRREEPFAQAPTAKLVDLGNGQNALLFTALAAAGGSGTATMLALLDFREGHLQNLLPDVTISNQAEYQMWLEPTISSTAMFVTADYVGGPSETHFSAHRYKIAVYGLAPIQTTSGNDQRFFLRDEYITSTKYPGLDDVDQIHVLEHERPEALARLRRQR